MDKLPTCTEQAGLEIGKLADILQLPKESDTTFAKFLNNCFRVIFCRVIIHDLYLHDLRPRCLHQHTRQCLTQVSRAIVSRYHYRPKRPRSAVSYGGNECAMLLLLGHS